MLLIAENVPPGRGGAGYGGYPKSGKGLQPSQPTQIRSGN